jgi:glutamyl-tRNA reductase
VQSTGGAHRFVRAAKIDPAAGQLENVTLYNIHDLEALAREGVRNRAGNLAACSKIIDAHVAALFERLESRRVATAFEHACEIC